MLWLLPGKPVTAKQHERGSPALSRNCREAKIRFQARIPTSAVHL
jgi:hypothetical protein